MSRRYHVVWIHIACGLVFARLFLAASFPGPFMEPRSFDPGLGPAAAMAQEAAPVAPDAHATKMDIPWLPMALGAPVLDPPLETRLSPGEIVRVKVVKDRVLQVEAKSIEDDAREGGPGAFMAAPFRDGRPTGDWERSVVDVPPDVSAAAIVLRETPAEANEIVIRGVRGELLLRARRMEIKDAPGVSRRNVRLKGLAGRGFPVDEGKAVLVRVEDVAGDNAASTGWIDIHLQTDKGKVRKKHAFELRGGKEKSWFHPSSDGPVYFDAMVTRGEAMIRVEVPDRPGDGPTDWATRFKRERAARKKAGQSRASDSGLNRGDAYPSGAKPILAARVRFSSPHVARGRYLAVGTGAPRLEPADAPDVAARSVFKMIPGLFDASLVSFESEYKPGHFLYNHRGKILLGDKADKPMFRMNATFHRVPGLADSSLVSLEAMVLSNHYVRQRYLELFVERGSGTLFKRDATFAITPVR